MVNDEPEFTVFENPGSLTVILLKSDCSNCGYHGYNWYCRECGAMYCDNCDCFCGDDYDT